jgi:hypothetical protein
LRGCDLRQGAPRSAHAGSVNGLEINQQWRAERSPQSFNRPDRAYSAAAYARTQAGSRRCAADLVEVRGQAALDAHRCAVLPSRCARMPTVYAHARAHHARRRRPHAARVWWAAGRFKSRRTVSVVVLGVDCFNAPVTDSEAALALLESGKFIQLCQVSRGELRLIDGWTIS